MRAPVTLERCAKFFDRCGPALAAMNWLDRNTYRTFYQHCQFAPGQGILEIGAGTGRMAEELLTHILPDSCQYTLTELSPVLAHRCRVRLARFASRATILHVQPDNTLPQGMLYDRVLSAYVHDLSSEETIRQAIDQLHGQLVTNGLFCMLVTSTGNTLLSHVVMQAWQMLYRINPILVGGSRPLPVETYFSTFKWQVVQVTNVSNWGFASKIIVAKKRADQLISLADNVCGLPVQNQK